MFVFVFELSEKDSVIIRSSIIVLFEIGSAGTSSRRPRSEIYRSWFTGKAKDWISSVYSLDIACSRHVLVTACRGR